MEIKDVLYQVISEYDEKRIVSDIAQGESPVTINAIFERCLQNLDKAVGTNPETRGALAEGLIHYLLTLSLIPSQRKIAVQSVDVDIVVPDAKTLSSSPDGAVVILFSKTSEPKTIKEQVEKLKKIQPRSENIWVVADEPVHLKTKVYTLDRKEFTFSNIINDLISFSSNTKHSKLKIFRI